MERKSAERLVVPGRSGKLLLAAAACAMAGGLALAVDLPLAQRLTHELRVPGDLRKLVELSEVFAHGLGIVLILLTVATLVPADRRRLPRVALAALGAGLLANVIKMLVARTRPGQLNDLETATVWQTFAGWLPVGWSGEPQAWTYSVQSFPSGHAAAAAGLAIGLAWLYPRGRWLFASFAALAAAQRVLGGAHFLSDVLFGASLACLWCAACFHARGLGGLVDRWERAAHPQARATRRRSPAELVAPR